MKTQQAYVAKPARAGFTATMVIAAALIAITAFAAPAMADGRHDDHRGGRDWHRHWHHPHPQPYYGGYGGPVYAAPPPVVYAPPPASPGINLILPLHIR